jgi:hypothetical protein
MAEVVSHPADPFICIALFLMFVLGGAGLALFVDRKFRRGENPGERATTH